MGTAALAAHQIVAQLWLLTSYVTDGFAVAGTVLGSRLLHRRLDPASSSDTRYCKHDALCLAYMPDIIRALLAIL